MRKKNILLTGTIAVTLAMAATTLPAMASGGGGGGSSTPSSSSAAPQRSFDPAQEYRTGIAAMQAQKYRNAERAFANVLSIAPKDANTNYLMGMAKKGRGKTKSSRRFFEKAIKYKPGFINAHKELGRAYALTGKADKAQKELNWFDMKLGACAQSCADVQALQRGQRLISKAIAGEDDQETDSGALILAPQQGDTAYLKAIRLINEKRYEEALLDLEEAALLIGPHPDILNYQGYSSRKLGRYNIAKRYYLAALKLNPEHRGANEYLGELYIETGEIKKARRQLAKLGRICTFACAEEEELKHWLFASTE